MHFMQKTHVVAIAAAMVVGSAGAAMAHGLSGVPMSLVLPAAHDYTGNWPVTVTHTQHGFTGCLTLTQSASNGGSALVAIGSQKYEGTFQIFNRTLVATLEAPGYGQNAGLVFIGSAGRTSIGPGVFDEVYGGEAFVEGALAFGAKGGC